MGKFSAKIESITNKGKVKIKFSKPISAEVFSRSLQESDFFNFTLIDDKVLDVTVIPNYN